MGTEIDNQTSGLGSALLAGEEYPVVCQNGLQTAVSVLTDSLDAIEITLTESFTTENAQCYFPLGESSTGEGALASFSVTISAYATLAADPRNPSVFYSESFATSVGLVTETQWGLISIGEGTDQQENGALIAQFNIDLQGNGAAGYSPSITDNVHVIFPAGTEMFPSSSMALSRISLAGVMQFSSSNPHFAWPGIAGVTANSSGLLKLD